MRSAIARKVLKRVTRWVGAERGAGADDPAFGPEVPRVPTPDCWVDRLGEEVVLLPGPPPTVTVHPEGTVGVGGWILDRESPVAGGRVRVLVDDVPHPAYYGGERQDVAEALGLPLMRLSGFRADVPAAAVGAGPHVLRVELAPPGRGVVLQSAELPFELALDAERPRRGEEHFNLWGRSMPVDREEAQAAGARTGLAPGSQAEARRHFATMNELALVLARNPFFLGTPLHTARPEAHEIIYAQFRASDLPLEEFLADVAGFTAYLERALPLYRERKYAETYGGERGHFLEKAFEHFVSWDYLRWKPTDRVLDLACWISPAGEALSRFLAPAEFWRHDITLETDPAARTVSGFADRIEAADGFFDAIMAHCAIDNFEGTADVDVFHEAARILRPGGRILIVPLHMAARFENLVALGSAGVQIDDGAHIVVGPPASLRFGRHYSVDVLRSRIVAQVPELRFHVVHVANSPVDEYPPTSTSRFMLIGTKPAQSAT